MRIFRISDKKMLAVAVPCETIGLRACFYFMQDAVGQGVNYEDLTIPSSSSKDQILVLSTYNAACLWASWKCNYMFGIFTVNDLHGSIGSVGGIYTATFKMDISVIKTS